MMFVNELLHILQENKQKFDGKVANCYFKDEHGVIKSFDYVEFLNDGTLIVSDSEDEELDIESKRL